ncbi:MAG TPA: segregation/condensation protein A [Geobacterales bacterium]|nr:segregation/condensation protein A [Geobacterales bacterium]
MDVQPLADDLGQTSYSVRLSAFEGPLDLLLHLIRKSQVDINDIPIADITRQYLEHLKLMKELNLEVAGEFLVMAATLLHIKSRTLLPPDPTQDEEEEEGEDPRAELVRRLLEYERFKEAAHLLEQMPQLNRDRFVRSVPSPELTAAAEEETELQVGLYELAAAFHRLLAELPTETFHDVAAEELSIADRIAELLVLMEGRESLSFDELMAGEKSRDRIIITFLSLLELCRLKMIRLMQSERFGGIWLVPMVLSADESEMIEESHGPATP